jgi:hypothetical protein
MSAPSGPRLSVLLVTPDSYASIRRVIRHLHAQNVRHELELIIVAPAHDALMLVPSELAGFASWRVVEIGDIESGGRMLACGVRAASAPLVVYVEEHSFPEPGWAEALIRAFDGPWTAVGPAVCNANPSSGISWATLFMEFGAWVLLPRRVNGICCRLTRPRTGVHASWNSARRSTSTWSPKPRFTRRCARRVSVCISSPPPEPIT